jgi:hypothetical protein
MPQQQIGPYRSERCAHDYLRHGLTSLFAAFNIAHSAAISEEHRTAQSSSCKVLVGIDNAVPADLDLPVICGTVGYADPSTEKSQQFGSSTELIILCEVIHLIARLPGRN